MRCSEFTKMTTRYDAVRVFTIQLVLNSKVDCGHLRELILRWVAQKRFTTVLISHLFSCFVVRT